MKAYEIIEKIFTFGKDFHYETTCDTLKSGSHDAEVSKVAITMNPTVDVIKDAKNWGAELLICHEPLYFNHMDEHSDEAIESEKRSLLEETGMTVYRFHDHPHRNPEDMIAEGFFNMLELDATVTHIEDFGLARAKLNVPMTSVEIAKRIEEKTGIKHVRIAGNRNDKCERITTFLGAPGDVIPQLSNPETEILIVGEVCEWRCAEYARDASQLGKKKALLVLGHAGSEEPGMIYIAEEIKKLLPELEIKYFKTGEVYTYTD